MSWNLGKAFFSFLTKKKKNDVEEELKRRFLKNKTVGNPMDYGNDG